MYIQYTNPAAYPPLEHSSRILAQEGWQVLFLGTDALGVNILSFPPRPKITVWQMPFCLPGWRQKLHYIQYCLWILVWTLRWKPNWIYASDLFACPIALVLSFLPGVKVLYHEHDSPNATPESAFLRFCLTTRRQLAQRANHCIFPNQQRADHFDKAVTARKHSLCVWNCPAQEEVVSQRSPWNHQTLWVLYHGSIVPDRLPLAVLQALATLPDTVKLRVIGYETTGHATYVQTLSNVAAKLGLSQRIEFLGAMPRKELLKWCQQSDVGLAFMPITTQDVNLSWMTGASNKPFDYLSCGLPLVVSNLPDWQDLYVKPGYGLACNPDDPDSIAEVLRWYLEHPVEMREMGDRGRRRILNEWNYEIQFSPVLKRLSEVQ
ncbi:glycosyltransferase [Egbenema bharatensis]|uniref:glycosyltransferase n=1 Tax=Egbenema bharatensis TaxID=3463334 RepID=UPI003A849840